MAQAPRPEQTGVWAGPSSPVPVAKTHPPFKIPFSPKMLFTGPNMTPIKPQAAAETWDGDQQTRGRVHTPSKTAWEHDYQVDSEAIAVATDLPRFSNEYR